MNYSYAPCQCPQEGMCCPRFGGRRMRGRFYQICSGKMPEGFYPLSSVERKKYIRHWCEQAGVEPPPDLMRIIGALPPPKTSLPCLSRSDQPLKDDSGRTRTKSCYG